MRRKEKKKIQLSFFPFNKFIRIILLCSAKKNKKKKIQRKTRLKNTLYIVLETSLLESSKSFGKYLKSIKIKHLQGDKGEVLSITSRH